MTSSPGRIRFLAIGEALVDLVQSREDGRFTAHPGGSPYNVAITLARLGARVRLAGQCGADGFGVRLTAKLTASGVDLASWRTLPEPTSLAVATLDEQGRAEYGFYFAGTAGLAFGPDAPPTDVDVLHAGSIASWLEPSASVIARMLGRARASGATLVCYDPNLRPALAREVADTRERVETCVAAAHIVKASDEDIAWLYPRTDAADVADRWCAMGATMVVVTGGAAGATAIAARGEIARCPAPAITVADTVGAGDALTGGLLAALAGEGLARPAALADACRDADPRIGTALRDAVTVAAITCERPGADPPTARELAAGPATARTAV